MLIGELSRRSGLSVDTLRFYEKIGLIPPPPRNGGGRRVYDAGTLDWIAFLEKLAATGMRQADRVRYARLRHQGDVTLAERRAMLEAHRTATGARLAELKAALAFIDGKIAQYARLEAALIHGKDQL